MGVQFTTDWVSRNVVNVRLDFTKSDEFWFLLISDVHWDNRLSDRKMFKRHLDQAKERHAGVISNGDYLCLMQGKFDPRSDQQQLRPEHRGNDYLDRVVETAHEFLEPYAENVIVMGHGNHETNVINRHGVDTMERLCALLKAKNDSPARCHGYSGWVVFRCNHHAQQQSIRLFRHHGFGGGAPVTKGVIQTARMVGMYPDAQAVLHGHTHDDWIFPIPRLRITNKGEIYKDEQLHLRVPGYLDTVQDGFEGWSVQQGHAIKGKGAMWLRIGRGGDDRRRRFYAEATRAK